MKILMFGWEFPPHISGGLGTACYKMTEALVKKNVQITFVLPKHFDDILHNGSKILAADEVSLDISQDFVRKYSSKLSFIAINSRLVPYLGNEDYYNVLNSQKIFRERRIFRAE